jgi:hypothetical protein
MKPTPKLRFVEREIEVNGDHKPVRILQQWWADFIGPLELDGEWRDVPLEAE